LDRSQSYTQLLRPVGQALEPLALESFSLTIEGDAVVVKGRRRREKPADQPSPRGFWQLLRAGRTASPQSVAEEETVELRYTGEELARMDHEGRSKRGARANADAHSLSQIIRAAGAFVDQKQGRLLAVSKDQQKIDIDYELPGGRRMTEEFTVPSLYEYWVKLYLKRSSRTEPVD
jgi:hypothetical protein